MPKHFKDYFENHLHSKRRWKQEHDFLLGGFIRRQRSDGPATNNADSVAVGSDAEKNIVILHSLTNLGGTLLRPTNHIVGDVGMGSNPIGVSISNGSF